MTLRKRLLSIGIASIVLVGFIFISPVLFGERGPAPRDLTLPHASLRADCTDLASLHQGLHDRGFRPLLESLTPLVSGAQREVLEVLASPPSSRPDRRAHWLAGEFALSIVEADDEAELPPGLRSPDPRRSWPFRRLRIAWRPEGIVRRATLAWVAQPFFWRDLPHREQTQRAGLEFDDEGLRVDHPAALLPLDAQRTYRRLPAARLERRGETFILTLGEAEARDTATPRHTRFAKPVDEALASASMVNPWSPRLGEAMRGLADDHLGSILASLIGPDGGAPLNLAFPRDGDVVLALDFASDVKTGELPAPPLLRTDLATVCSASSAFEVAAAAVDAEWSRPESRRTRDLAEARRWKKTRSGSFDRALERLRDRAASSAPDRAPLWARIHSAPSTLDTDIPAVTLGARPSIAPLFAATDLRIAAELLSAGDDEALLVHENDDGIRAELVRQTPLVSNPRPAALPAPERTATNEDLRPAALRARVSLEAWRDYALSQGETRTESWGLPTAGELLASRQRIEDDLRYAMGRDPAGDVDPEFRDLVDIRLQEEVTRRQRRRNKTSRARLKRLARLDLGSWRAVAVDLVPDGSGRRRLEVRPLSR